MPSAIAATVDPVLAFIGNIGGGEILIILLVALIVVGPQRLPDAARSIGKAMGELRRASSGFQSEIRGVIDDAGVTDDDTRTTARSNAARREGRQRAGDTGGTAADAAAEVSRQAAAPRRPRRTEPLRAEPDAPGADDGEEQ
jgi:Tat protein translocase TatB subunit